ncbi:26S proteasome regulatory subunit rpn10 [Neolecta irregularis DAH-3]|uniref:26S proteasome regulatory subunit rpn10 n=1 Tax=Neolecta irregularis (strain DAH-3) TaxID=1198029 RepID=A0A1U7LVW1_NEOID|nr:26S proteasome regulatory subunit rpn10 [Neolecta irregularis DAH-3]|eukprot:OLL26774.1 26S proteasome regulatory subunit rpn10 [Neolecta irregularis DAH-3]
MVLEATMIIIDNSEFMRNGDYTPTRFEAQLSAVHLLFNAKTQANPENAVGIMTMAGKSPEVKSTLTTDFGAILAALHDVKISESCHFTTAIQIAQLALKHRENKNQRQRIVVLTASPISEDTKDLVKLAKKLKKNNISVDIISFGEDSTNEEKVEAFIQNINSAENSHLVTIPPGPHLLSDMLLGSTILGGDGEVGGVAASGSGEQFEFGVDPSLDPELALALKMSMEEEKARQEAGERKKEEEDRKMQVDNK